MLPSDSAPPITGKDEAIKKIPLFSLPFLASKEALRQMRVYDLAELSLLSKNATSVIKSHRLTMNTIALYVDSVGIWKYAETKSSGPDYMGIYKKEKLEENDQCRMIGGCQFRSWTYKGLGKVHCVSEGDNDILKIFHHFNELFKTQEFTYIFHGHTKAFVENFMLHIPNRVQTMTIGDYDDEGEERIMAVLAHCTIHDVLMCFTRITRLHEKLNGIQNLFLYSVKDISLCDILRLNAESVHLLKQEFTTEDLAAALNTWKTERWSCKSLYIKLVWKLFNVKEVQQKVDARACNPEPRDKKDQEEGVWEDHMVIERDDGVLASIGIYEEEFLFIVRRNGWFLDTA